MIYKNYQYIEMREGIGKPAQQILTNTEKKWYRYSFSKSAKEVFSMQGVWHSPNM